MNVLQDAVTLAMDPEIATAITITQTELEHVRELRKLRPDDKQPSCFRWYQGEADVEVIRRFREVQLEQAITDACTRLSMATTQDQAYTEFECIRVLIAQRSPEQIVRMERARGLRK